jgi:hypothetical protein
MWLEESATRADPNAAQAAVVAPEEDSPAPAPIELPEELKAALSKVDDLKALVGNLQHQVRSSDGRVQTLAKELQSAKQATQSVARAPNDQSVRAAAKTPEKWAKLKDEFPEWGDAVESLVDTLRVEQPTVDLTPMQTEIQNQINGIVQQFSRAVEEAKLFGAYKNYKTTVNSEEFVGWWKQQPGDIQALTASQSAEDAIRALDMFEEHKTKARDASRNVTQERGARLQAAAAPAKRTAAPPPKDDRELTATDLWAQESERRAQIRASRI